MLNMSDPKNTAATIQNNSVMLPNGNGKAAAVAPKLSDDDHVEMEDMLPSGPAQSPDDDIMQLARLGDIQGIERLYESGTFDAQYCDAEGITPLHVLRLKNFNPNTVANSFSSGPQSTTSMRCANSF